MLTTFHVVQNQARFQLKFVPCKNKCTYESVGGGINRDFNKLSFSHARKNKNVCTDAYLIFMILRFKLPKIALKSLKIRLEKSLTMEFRFFCRRPDSQ